MMKRAIVLSAMNDANVVPVGSIDFAFSAMGGDFNDKIQQNLKDKLVRLNINQNQPIIVFCHHEICWLSYNSGLRLTAAGYTNVKWMRDGIAGWYKWGLSVSKLKPTP